jgi:hypothetical protein
LRPVFISPPQPSPEGRGSQYLFGAQRTGQEIRVHQTAAFHQPAPTPPSQGGETVRGALVVGRPMTSHGSVMMGRSACGWNVDQLFESSARLPSDHHPPNPGLMKSLGCRASTFFLVLLRGHPPARDPSPQPSPEGRGRQASRSDHDERGTPHPSPLPRGIGIYTSPGFT